MSYFIMLKALSLTLSLKHCLVVLITVQNFKDTYLRHYMRWNNLIISVYRAVISIFCLVFFLLSIPIFPFSSAHGCLLNNQKAVVTLL